MPHLVGTAGYVYPHWRRKFYPATTPQNKELSYYLSHFPAVEINATWHAFPRQTTLANWRAAAHEHTRFSLKAPAVITHTKRLQNTAEDVAAFLKLTTDALEHHLAVVLFQTPPSLPFSLHLLNSFLDDVDNALASCVCSPRIAIEFRNRAYFCADVYQLLAQRDVALVNNVIVKDDDFYQVDDNHFPHCRDVPDCKQASWTYTRFHGSKTPNVATKYPDDVLRPFAEKVSNEDTNTTHFSFFLNDLNAEAPKSAQRFVELLATGRKVSLVLGGFVPVWAKKKRGIDAFFGPKKTDKGGSKSGDHASKSAVNNVGLSSKKTSTVGMSPKKASAVGLSPKKGIAKPIKQKPKLGTIGAYFAAKTPDKG